MNQLTKNRVFNRTDVIVEGWYWALRSDQVKKGQVQGLNFMGREIVIARSEDGVAFALDAYCPHMGAHLKEGKVDGHAIRCLFHYWKFDQEGTCVEIPCQKSVSGVQKIRRHHTSEQYGLIWVWASDDESKAPRHPVPFVPELSGKKSASRLAHDFIKTCHPNVMMINAIDAQHFNSVHAMPIPLDLSAQTRGPNWITFQNETRAQDSHILKRLLGALYRKRLTYDLSYWNGSTGSVTLGPDFLHFHIIFALRPTADGRSLGQTILLTNHRPGVFGWFANQVLLFLTLIVGNYFAKGDTLIFSSIKFDFKSPIRADRAIIQFIQHLDDQKSIGWGLEPLPTEGQAFSTVKIDKEVNLWM